MKRIFVLTTLLCCLCLAVSVSAGETITYTDCGKCKIATKTTNGFFGTSHTYGFVVNGKEVLKPDCDTMMYNEDIHQVAFIYLEGIKFRIVIFSTDSGKCIYSKLWPIKGDKLYVTYHKNGKYVNAVVNHSELTRDKGMVSKKTTIGTFYRENGKTYRKADK